MALENVAITTLSGARDPERGDYQPTETIGAAPRGVPTPLQGGALLQSTR